MEEAPSKQNQPITQTLPGKWSNVAIFLCARTLTAATKPVKGMIFGATAPYDSKKNGIRWGINYGFALIPSACTAVIGGILGTGLAVLDIVDAYQEARHMLTTNQIPEKHVLGNKALASILKTLKATHILPS